MGVAAEEFDALLLAEAEFAEAGLDSGFGGELFDAHDHADLHAAQGTNQWARALSGHHFVGLFQFAQADLR